MNLFAQARPEPPRLVPIIIAVGFTLVLGVFVPTQRCREYMPRAVIRGWTDQSKDRNT